MKIDQLPLEMLMDIFSYLTRYNEVSLVNKVFYIAACKMNDPNIYLTIDDSFFYGQWTSNMSYIIDSTRQISRLNIYSLGKDQTELRAVIAIIKKFSQSIKYLSLKIVRLVDMSVFLEILSLTPNVQHLICDNLRLRNEDQASLDKLSSNGNINLSMLKKLSCRSCFNNFSVVFNRIPMRVITDLDLHDFNFNNEATTLLGRQTTIRKLKLTVWDSNYVTSNIFDNLTLEALELWHRPADNFDLASVLSKQTNLRSLKLRLVEVDTNLIELVANQFTELETFSLDGPFSMPRSVSIAQIIRLKRLRNVTFLFKLTDELGLAKSLAKSYNPGITSLTIGYGIYKFDLIQALAKTVPNLKVLKLNSDLYSMEADGFMRNFNFVEVLEIRRIVAVPLNDTKELTERDYFNPTLKELIINGDFVNTTRFLNKLIASYPNLRKLAIKWKSIGAGQFKEILEGFAKLEWLRVNGVTSFKLPTKHFLDYIRQHRKNLKFIAVNGRAYKDF